LTKDTVDTVLRIIEDQKPESVDQLANLARQRLQLPKKEIIKQILWLQDEGKITLRQPPQQAEITLKPYLRTESAYWYWITMLLAGITTIATFAIPEDAFPIVYARYILAAVFVLYLPGYTFIRALFPKLQTTRKHMGQLDFIERIALSIGLSLCLIPIIGLLLNYTPWGIRLTPIVLSLLVTTLVFSTIAVVREHQFLISASKLAHMSAKKG
jgi:hypothetical protein